MEDTEWASLEGSVESITFRNSESGWTVMELAVNETLETVVGVFPSVNVGEYLKLKGKFGEHRQFGRQFRAEMCERYLPTDTASILRYLSSGAVKGIGVATAIRIVERFGDTALDILENHPERLAEIKGISKARAVKMGESYAEQFGLREVMVAVTEYNLTPNEAIRCWKRFGNRAVELVRDNPYALCDGGIGISFERVDQICAAKGLPQDSDHRVDAGVLYILRHNLGNGHTCLPVKKVIPTACDLLGLPEETVLPSIERLVLSMQLKEEVFADETFLFLPAAHRAERHIAAWFAAHSEIPRERISAGDRMVQAERALHIIFAEQQREAIAKAVEKGMLILTGGPGTGKTTTLKGIIWILEQMGEEVALAAPTGRAAKRMTELTGREAKTLHRLLEVEWDEQDEARFNRNEKNPLDADTVIVDEMSMVDAYVFDSLLRALRAGTRLILVGDTDQLPSVGPGCVLQDLIGSHCLPIVPLTEVFRQAKENRIVANAHRILAGEMPLLTGKQGDFFFMPRFTEGQVTETVLDLCRRRLPSTYDYTVFDHIQILCPGRKGALGVRELNRRLQQELNPPSDNRREWEIEGILFREGDKVMHNRNNYDITWVKDDEEVGTGVFNGDIGFLEQISPQTATMTVRYDDRVATYSKEDARDLELAYAVTVHKSQGSEFDAVILPLYRVPTLLCYRNLLYTAVTRAKQLLIIVGEENTVAQMVHNHKRTLRYSGLGYFMREGSSWIT